MRFFFATLLTGVSVFADAPPSLRILFVGNSLTYTNDLPAMVARLGARDGRRVETAMLAHPNYSLGDHLDAGQLQTLARKRWDFVVLQQGPSSLAESRADLIRDTKRIGALFAESRIAMLTVWPSRRHAASWDRVIESYALAAREVDGIVIPAGVALRSAQALPLLSGDGFHPAPAGTYLAALVTYRTIAGSLPPEIGDPKIARKIAGTPLRISDAELKLLAAHVAR